MRKKKKIEYRLTTYVDEETYNFVLDRCEELGLMPSEYLRMKIVNNKNK